MNWCQDASFAVHPNLQSHMGVVLSLSGGAVYLSSAKQKLNTRNSTEKELVSAKGFCGLGNSLVDKDLRIDTL